ncbi:Rv3654c family TadE-like protein [Nocardia sp. CA-128927]|uniref:Rv3654c family TadE-like protein n=1 Tax=Nocardia sp. CA-128927 TaxID=3239975 RepID=UPI003D95C4B8
MSGSTERPSGGGSGAHSVGSTTPMRLTSSATRMANSTTGAVRRTHQALHGRQHCSSIGQLAPGHWPGRRRSHRGSGSARMAGAVIRLRADTGAATVFACLALAGLIAATLMVGQVGVVVVTRHRAQAAADLAALAAAGGLAEGVDAGCRAAGEVVRRMGAQMEGCAVAEWDATVIVNRNVPIGLLGVRMVRAVARAGPVED